MLRYFTHLYHSYALVQGAMLRYCTHFVSCFDLESSMCSCIHTHTHTHTHVYCTDVCHYNCELYVIWLCIEVGNALYCLIWVIHYFPYCSITVHTKPLDIVYNRSTIGRVQNFFSTPLPKGNLKDKLQLQGLKNTLGELFESEDRVSDVEVTSGLQFKDQSTFAWCACSLLYV